MKVLLAFLLLTAAASADPPPALRLDDLRCENLKSPAVVHTAAPTFGWKLIHPGRGIHQSEYHILAASSAEKLAADEGDLWDSGPVASFQSQLVPFRGDPLKDGQEVHWKVRIKGRDQAASPWSAPARFKVALQDGPPKPATLFVADAPRLSDFECSDENLTKLYDAAAAALPRLTSLRDTQLTIRAASYHQDLFPRAKHWLAWLNDAQTEEDFYPATLPPTEVFGSTQSDAGILATHALWGVSNDQTLLTDHWTTMNKYLFARKKHDPVYVGRTFGTLPEDSLPKGDPTPPSLLHLASHGLCLRIMTELSSTAAKTPFETPLLKSAHQNLQKSFKDRHLKESLELKYDSLTAQLVTLRYGLLSTSEEKKAVGDQVLQSLKNKQGVSPLSHSPLASAALLPVLTWLNNHEQALAIAKSQNAESLSPVALAALGEWLIWMVAGIEPEVSGYRAVRLAPYIPKKETLSFAKAHLDSPYGRITTHWRHENDDLVYEVTLPPNTSGAIRLPAKEGQRITESGKPLAKSDEILVVAREAQYAFVRVLSGSYKFTIHN